MIRIKKDIIAKAVFRTISATEGEELGRDEYSFFNLCETMYETLGYIENDVEKE